MGILRYFMLLGLVLSTVEISGALLKRYLFSSVKEGDLDGLYFLAKVCYAVEYWLTASLFIVAAYESVPTGVRPKTPLAIGLGVFICVIASGYLDLKQQLGQIKSERSEGLLTFQHGLSWVAIFFYGIAADTPNLAYNELTRGLVNLSSWLVNLPVIGWLIGAISLLAGLSLLVSGVAPVALALWTDARKPKAGR